MKSFITIFFILFYITAFGQKYAENTLILKLNAEYAEFAEKNNISITHIQAYLHKIGSFSIEQKFPLAKKENNACKNCVDLSLIYEINYKSTLSTDKLLNYLNSLIEIEYATLKPIPELFEVPNDPLNEAYQYYLQTTNAYEAYDLSKGDSTIIIGIIDTGIDFYHEDLAENIAYNIEDSINGIDDDNDGFKDNFRGWDLGENDNNPQVSLNPYAHSPYHGIFVSGIVGARTNNDIGISGVGYKCKILPVKVSDDLGVLTHSYEGIVYAAGHGCQIINCSWGNKTHNPYAEDVINYAVFNKGALVIAAAGNDGNEGFYYPASFNYVISVAGTNQDDVKWSNSNYNYKIDIAAPGSAVYSTTVNSQYSYGWGTSFASPIIAGAVGIAKAYFPDYSMLQIGELLKTTSDIIDTIADNQTFAGKLGSGRVNLYNALIKNPKPSVNNELISVSTDNQYFEPGSTIELTFEFTNYLSMVSSTSIFLTDNSDYINYHNRFFIIDTLKALESIISDPYSFSVMDEIPYNYSVDFELYTIENILMNNSIITLNLNKTYLNVQTPKLKSTVTSNGRIGYLDHSNNLGQGFIYNEINNFLYQCGIMAGNSTYKIVSSVYDMYDFIPLNRPEIIDTLNNVVKINSKYKDDIELEYNINILIDQNTYYHLHEDSSNFIIVEYLISNQTNNPIEDFYFSIFADWDISHASYNKANYLASEKIIYTYATTDQNYYTGIHLLSNQSVSYYNIDNIEGGNGGIDVTNGFSTEEKYFVMTNNRYESGIGEEGNDVINVLTAGPLNLFADDTAVIVFTLIAAENLYILKNSAQMAQNIYEDIYTSNKLPDYSTDDTKIFPSNPKPGSIIKIESDKNFIEIQLYSSEMKFIAKKEINDKNKKIQYAIPDVSSGIYFIKLLGENNYTESKRILIIE